MVVKGGCVHSAVPGSTYVRVGRHFFHFPPQQLEQKRLFRASQGLGEPRAMDVSMVSLTEIEEKQGVDRPTCLYLSVGGGGGG